MTPCKKDIICKLCGPAGLLLIAFLWGCVWADALSTTWWIDPTAGPSSPAITTRTPNPSGKNITQTSQQSFTEVDCNLNCTGSYTNSYIYTNTLNGTYNSGTYTFYATMWTTQGYTQNVYCALYKTSADGSTRTLLKAVDPVVCPLSAYSCPFGTPLSFDPAWYSSNKATD